MIKPSYSLFEENVKCIFSNFNGNSSEIHAYHIPWTYLECLISVSSYYTNQDWAYIFLDFVFHRIIYINVHKTQQFMRNLVFSR